MPVMRDIGGGFFGTRFFWGARFAFGGISWVFKHRTLWWWSLTPMVVQAALFGALLVGGFHLAGLAVDALGPEAGHWYSFIGRLLMVGAKAMVVLGSIVTTLLVGSALCDTFYDVLSEKTESVMLGRDVSLPLTPARIFGGMAREFAGIPWRLFLYLLVSVPLWLLSATGVAAVVSVPLSLAWTWLFVALSGLSRSFARHSVRRRVRLWSVLTMPSTALGFGAVGWAISHVPLTYPFLVVGGTRLYLHLAAFDRLPNTLTEADKAALREGGALPHGA